MVARAPQFQPYQIAINPQQLDKLVPVAIQLSFGAGIGRCLTIADIQARPGNATAQAFRNNREIMLVGRRHGDGQQHQETDHLGQQHRHHHQRENADEQRPSGQGITQGQRNRQLAKGKGPRWRTLENRLSG